MCLENRVPLTPEAATSFLVGIFFDTGGFQHQTTSATLWCVGKLLRAGGNLDRVVEYLNHSTGPEALQVWGYALQNLSIEDTPSLAHSRIPHSVLKKHNLSSKELQLDKLALLIGTISESSFGLLATEYKEGKHKGSFRTDAFKNVDVERIASQLGGGGHTYASGFRYDGDYAALLADIEQAWHNKESSSVAGSVAE
ncbi:MAG: hypothetical protein BRC23_00715 [Parcubacteria group bacterium SW_4_49_11]|nr:MAG: hypothetical protein BRC23_00715 [Parcubacteria group bacterium SW_4_49_11]